MAELEDIAERSIEARSRGLLALTVALSGASTIEDVARALVDGAISVTGAAAASLSLVVSESEFEVVHAVGLPTDSVTVYRRYPRVPGRPLSDAVISREPVYLGRREAWHARYASMASAIDAIQQGALAVVPVKARAGIVAGLMLAWSEEMNFDAPLRHLLETVGELCGQSIERARLHEAERLARADAESAVAQLQDQATELEMALELAQEAATEAEEARRRAEESERLLRQATARERVLSLLGGALADALARGEGPGGSGRARRDEALQQMAAVVVPEIADWCIVDIVESMTERAGEPAVGRRIAMTHADPAKRWLLDEMLRRWPPDPTHPTLGRVAMATGKAQLIEEVTDEILSRVVREPDQFAIGRQLGMKSAMVVPLAARGMIHGVAVLVSATHTYTTDDLALAEEIGRRASLAVDNARLLFETERRRAELEAVLDVVPIGIGIGRDPECRDVRVNPAFAEQLGVRSDANASKSAPDADALPFRLMMDGRELSPDELPLQRAARERRTIDGVEIDVVHADGRVVRLLEYAAPLLDASGDVHGAVGAFVDITERSRLVAAERTAREAAEDASRAKTELLSIVSHELRTPVNSVLSHAQLIEMGLHGPVTEAQAEALHRISRSAQHLTALITDLLNLARIEQGRVTYQTRDVDARDALELLAGLLAPQAAELKIALQVEPQPAPVIARADPDRLQQILLNLVGNALKFTDAGGSVMLRAITDGTSSRIEVQDTGRGIPDDHLEVIFDRFVQVDSSLTRRAGGLGLGLSISRDLARGMGGDLHARSALGVGSTFVLTLPRA